MSTTRTLIETLDYCYLDASDAFKALAPEHLHKRPTPKGALAISEIAAHIAYCEAYAILKILFGKSRKVWELESPLFLSRNWYPPEILKHPIHKNLLELTPSDVHSEVERVHRSIMERLGSFDEEVDKDLDGAWGSGSTIRSHLSYLIYHVSYHIGQIYLTRHFFGEKTPSQA